jgi:hypothetical protein
MKSINSFHWKKGQRIFVPSGDNLWAKTHAQVPRSIKLGNDRIRVFYTTRDGENRSNISYIDINPSKPEQILYEHNSPILQLGNPGTFDDSGIMTSDVIWVQGKIYLYYVGWNRGTPARYRTAIGLAISEDSGQTFYKYSSGPIMERNIIDPISVSCQAIIYDEKIFKTWYMSYTKWELINGVFEPFYKINYAESVDGIRWNRDGKTAIDLSPGEGGVACPTVIKIGRSWYMWYSSRGINNYRNDKNTSYTIREARSSDGINWHKRNTNDACNLSRDSWNDEMIAYPNIIQDQNKLIMFYNGNGFGQSGFGYAELEL